MGERAVRSRIRVRPNPNHQARNHFLLSRSSGTGCSTTAKGSYQRQSPASIRRLPNSVSSPINKLFPHRPRSVRNMPYLSNISFRKAIFVPYGGLFISPACSPRSKRGRRAPSRSISPPTVSQSGGVKSRGGTMRPPAPAHFPSCKCVTRFLSQPGSAITSSSRKAIISPRAARIPALRARERPCLGSNT